MDIINFKECSRDSKQLIELLKRNFDDHFDFHPEFYDEFVELIIDSGSERIILSALITKLKMIIELGDIDCGTKWLERLKKYDNMYSLKLKAGSKNYRLLFSKTNSGKIFLHTFYEKSGKTDSSYKKHVPIAIERRNNYK